MRYHVSTLLSIFDHYGSELYTEVAKVGPFTRRGISTDKDCGITNDANLYATETMNNPQYTLELLQRVITVSEETNKIVARLPALNL